MQENTALKISSTQTSISALLAIRDFENTKVNYQLQLKSFEYHFEEFVQAASKIIKEQTTAKIVKEGQNLLQELKESFDTLHKAFNAIIIRIELKNRFSAAGLWNVLHIQVEILKSSFQNLVDFGNSYLEDSAKIAWENIINDFQIVILQIIQSFITSCKLELKIIESYSANELSKILSNNLKNFPTGFTFEEATDYVVVLKDWESNFAREKKLWGIFVKIINEI